jgi:DNA primase
MYVAGLFRSFASMRIPEEIVRQIQQTADIVDVVGDYVSLKKRGVNLIACCPFHNEKTPSFNVNPVRGIYKCFGCGKAGDSVKFVMDIEGVSYPEALRHLAKKYGIEIPEIEQTPEEIAAQNERESLYIALNFAKTFYGDQLTKTDEGQSIGLSYFRERGFSDPTMQAFELGYSPESWDAFTKTALKQGFSIEVLERAGLSIRRDARAFDRFRARVIFPIHNLSGRVIAFGARILKPDKNQPKYLNSPETEVYHKSNVLYGIFQAKNAIRAEEVAYLVEGYTDVISLHQAGIKNVVASSGTALTVEQIRLIGRFSPNVTVLFDGDAAGLKASLRGLDLILEEGLNVKLCAFPDGEDPDSYVRKLGSEAFKKYVETKAKDFIRFKAEVLLQDAGDDPFRRADVIREMVESIVKIPDSIKRTVFIQQTASLMGIGEEVLVAEANKIVLKGRKEKGDRRGENGESRTPNRAADQRSASRIEHRTSNVEGTPPPLDLPPGVSPPNEAPSTPNEAPAKPARAPISYHEEEFARLLVCYGTHELEPGVSLAHYLLGEIPGLDFQTPAYQKILNYCRAQFLAGTPPDTQAYLAHPDELLQRTSIDFVTSRYDVSENWHSMHEIYVPKETDLLDRLAHTCVLRLKKAFNDQRMATLKQQLTETTDATAVEVLLMQFMDMKRIDRLLCDELGIVVAR